jgi:hypothetical protein
MVHVSHSGLSTCRTQVCPRFDMARCHAGYLHGRWRGCLRVQWRGCLHRRWHGRWRQLTQFFPKLNFSIYKSITAQLTYIPGTTHIHFSPTNAQQFQNRYINPRNGQIAIYFTILTEITRISTDQQITYIFYLASPPTVWWNICLC